MARAESGNKRRTTANAIISPGEEHSISVDRSESLHARFFALRKQLDEVVVSQDEAKDWLALVAAEHEHHVVLPEGWPRVVLLVGPTGSGKTELARTLAKIMSLPFFRFDASEMSHTSFHGRQIGDIFKELSRSSHNVNESRATKMPINDRSTSVANGVVMVDEFDKIAFNQETRASAVQERHFEAVQTTFLPLFEGKQVSRDDPDSKGIFDTSRLLILAGGSFSNPAVAKTVRDREGKRLSATQGHWAFIQHEDLIQFGFLPELVGRIRAIVPLERLKAIHYSEILSRAVENPKFYILGCRIEYEAGVLEELAIQAEILNLGARAVGIVFEKVKLHVYRGVDGISVDKEEGIILISKLYVDKYWSIPNR